MSSHPQAIQALSEREKGQIQISIGTSLALEGAFGILEDNKVSAPIIDQVDVLYVNVRTLVRNLVGSMTTEQNDAVFPEDLANTLVNEMLVMKESVSSFTNGRVPVVFYLCSYQKLNKRFPKALHKAANTDKQKYAALREENTIISLEEILDSSAVAVDIQRTDIDLADDPRWVLMLTSYAIDLLQRYRFRSISLLESHTGNVKAPHMFHTKLTGGKDLTYIPFDRMTVQFFGDNGNLFSPYPIKARRRLIEIAKENKWTFGTTKDYIISCVNKAYEPELEKLLKSLYAK